MQVDEPVNCCVYSAYRDDEPSEWEALSNECDKGEDLDGAGPPVLFHLLVAYDQVHLLHEEGKVASTPDQTCMILTYCHIDSDQEINHYDQYAYPEGEVILVVVLRLMQTPGDIFG